MAEFKEGDLIKVKSNCSGADAGRVYQLFWRGIWGDLSSGRSCLWACDAEGERLCSCSSNWEKVENKMLIEDCKGKIAVGDLVKFSHNEDGSCAYEGKICAITEDKFWGNYYVRFGAKYEVPVELHTGFTAIGKIEILKKAEKTSDCKFDLVKGEVSVSSTKTADEPQKKSIMTKIIDFAKDLILSADEKLLRKYGLKDECGNYTLNAKELVIEKLTKENEIYLLEIAGKFEAEEVKK